MKKLLTALMVLVVLSSAVFADAPFHIGVVTGTVSQSEDDLRGAEALIAEYGAVSEGGYIQHMTYPDNFMEEQETTISVIAGLADDPHLAMEKMQRRRAIMIQTCNELGMEFVDVSAPDPTSDVGIAGAQQYILEQTPAWIERYGQNTAFFCTNDAHTEPLLRQLMQYGGYFVEADLPSPLMGYPGALGIDLSAEAGDFPAILAKVEAAIVEQGGAGRFGTWAYSYGYTTTAGLGRLAIEAVEAEMNGEEYDYTSIRNIRKAFQAYTPGANWNGSYYVDANSGVSSDNFVLVYQDTYIMGDPGYYMGNTDVEVPEWCFYMTGKEFN